MELTISLTQLVSQVDIHLSNLVTHTTGKALSVLPVHIVGGRGTHGAWAVDGHIAHAIHLVATSQVVVTQSDSNLRNGLVLSTQLECRNTLERLLGVTLHRIVLRGLCVVVVVVTIDNAVLTCTVVGILISSAKC